MYLQFANDVLSCVSDDYLLSYFTGCAPVTAITFLDKLILKEKDAAFKMAKRTTGSSNQTTSFITKYITGEHDKTSREMDRAALDILDSALVSAERFIQFRKQQARAEVMAEGSVLCLSAKNDF